MSDYADPASGFQAPSGPAPAEPADAAPGPVFPLFPLAPPTPFDPTVPFAPPVPLAPPVPFDPPAPQPPDSDPGRRLAGGWGAAVAAAVLVVGGYAIAQLWGGGGSLGGPPQLTTAQFDHLAQDFLPDEGLGEFYSHAPFTLSESIADQLCPSSQPVADGLIREASGVMELKLFDTADQAAAYTRGWSGCVNDLSRNHVSLDERSEGDIIMVEIEAWGVTFQRLAAYGNVVAVETLGRVDWDSFARDDLKPAMDQAAQS
ncbi:MAG: hypothetical protein LBK42_06295 [Propionibacteriaceae bacterium]|jgi:hypothetical protein|nr:hypothetical protein [Propionibacteriaceae bacterium]